jgi:hypothetical protein
MDHLYWADGRILDALEESETNNKDLLFSARSGSLAVPIAGQGQRAIFVGEEAEDLTAIRTMFDENATISRLYRRA